ncbi:MAG: S1-like domain-containing RNA-binding protein [Desulfobacterales bacterium]|nr:S1-like domain-containing RNA-binding protein [Desulfobacterales bacterium]
MLKIGEMNRLVAERKMEFGFYLNPKEEQVLLPNKYVPKGFKLGDAIDVFVYTDSEDRPVATTLTPKAMVGDFALLTVKDVNAIGAFMDWGLEKDLLVPRSEQQRPMEKGREYVVFVGLDEETGRVYGSTRISRYCSKTAGELKGGEKIELLIYGETKLGFQAIVNGHGLGVLYRNEVFEKVRIGDLREGYISRVRDDGKLDLTLKKPGYASVEGSSEKLEKLMRKAGGSLSIHDKSSPEEIKAQVQMSKKEFKRAVGVLYKKGVLVMRGDGISLKSEKTD